MSLGHKVAISLRDAYWAMHRQADSCLQPLGVTANQFVLLSLLAEQGGITQREVVRRASSDPNTVRAMLVALEGKGLVARHRHPTDGRARRVSLTAKGRRIYKKLWAESESFRERLVSLFQPEETEAFVDFLGRMAAAMGSRDREPPLRASEEGGRS